MDSRNKIEVQIPYKDGIKKIPISFVSNRMNKMIVELMEYLDEESRLYAEMQEVSQCMMDIVYDKDVRSLRDKYLAGKPLREDLKKLKLEFKENSKKISIEKRFALIEILLADNDIVDEELYTVKFWDQEAESTASWNFLTTAVLKDSTGSKKKVM